MATEELELTAENEAPTTEAATSSLGTTVDTRIYRAYGIIDEEGTPRAYDPQGNISKKPIVRQQTADGKAWETLEAQHNTKLNENSFVFYTVETDEAFSELVPELSQRMYLINKGLAAIQTTKANSLTEEFDPTTKTFAYSDQTIDLRTYINEPPERRKMTANQKLMRDVSVLAPDQIQEFLRQLQALAATQGISA